jgi:dTDP-L-rhamnose 4-epimerase
MEPIKNRETDKVTPTSIYGITKHNQEQMLLVFGKAHGIPCYSMRYQNVFGPGQSLLNPYTGVLNVFAQQIQNGVTPEIYEEGHPVRDFILVDDIVDCTMEGFFNDNANGKVFNVGRGEPMPIAEVGRILMKLMGMEGDPVMSKKYRVGDVLFGCADMTAAHTDLNWKAKFTPEEGIRRFVDSLKDKGPLKDYSEVAENELVKAGLMGGS